MDQSVQQPQIQPPHESPEVVRSEPITAPEKPKSKKGKKVLLALLTILLIVGAAAGGWYYGTTQAQKDADAKTAELNAKIAKLEKTNKELSVSSKKETSNNFLVIKEWGVKLPLNDAMTGAVYSIKGDKAYLSTKTLAGYSKYCDPSQTLASGEPNSAIRIAKGTETQKIETPDGMKTVKQAYPDGVTIEGVYYYVLSPQALCSGETQQQTDQEVAFVNGVKSEFKSLQTQ